MKRGKLIIVSAPSGTGKSTLIQHLLRQPLDLHFSRSATSRPPRGQERDGVEYFFLTPEQFKEKIAQGAFLEYEEVYKDRFYGTLRSEVESQLEAGHHIVLDIDVKGGVRVKKAFGPEALAIFVMPPSIDALRQRLIARGTDSPATIQSRIDKAEFELSYAPRYDCTVVNDRLEEAEEEIVQIVKRFIDPTSTSTL